MTDEWFLENYFKLKSLEVAIGDEMPETEELLAEARAAGIEVDRLLAHYKQPPDILLWS